MSYDPSHSKPPRQERWPQATPPEAWPSYREGDGYQDGEQADSRYGADRQAAYQATDGYQRQVGYQHASGEAADQGYQSAVATDTFPPARNGYGAAGSYGAADGYGDARDFDWAAVDGYVGAGNGYTDPGNGYGAAGNGNTTPGNGQGYRAGGYPGGGYAGGINGYAGAADDFAGAPGGYGSSRNGYTGTIDGYPGATDDFPGMTDGFDGAAHGYGHAEGDYGRAVDEYPGGGNGYDWNENGYVSTADGYADTADGYVSPDGFADARDGYAGYQGQGSYTETPPSDPRLTAPDVGVHPDGWQADQDRRREASRRGLGVGAVTGFLAAAVAIGVSTLAAGFVRPQASPMAALGSVFIDRTPAALKNVVVQHFGTHGRTVLLLAMYAAIAVLAVGIGVLARRGAALGVAGLAAFGLIAAFVTITRPGGTLSDVTPVIVGGVAGVGALLWLTQASAPAAPRRRARGNDRRRPS